MDINHQQSRIAITEDQDLKEFYIERQDHQRLVGNIYKGRVENVLHGMQAAFINIGIEKNAFLYIRDTTALIRRWGDNAPLPSIHSILKPGQEILVQIVKEPIAQKGARVTTNISLPGRYLVLLPFAEYIGISRRIGDERERERLRTMAQENIPENMGVIIRTEAEGIGVEDLKLDLELLLKLWEKISRLSKTSVAPKLIHRELELIYKTIRDNFTREIDELVINDREHYEKALDMVGSISPELRRKVVLYDQPYQIFHHYGVSSQMDEILRDKIWLRCGGYIVIDTTEALTIIDVNTGKFVGKSNLKETVLKTNLEAAQEIAKQVRLRDIGGIIIIDFIDMKNPEDEEKVLDQLKGAFKEDKTRTNILGITQLGLVEMTRKKARKSIGRIIQQNCPICDGTGRVKSADTYFLEIQEIIKNNENLMKEEQLYIVLHPHSAYLLDYDERNFLERLEKVFDKRFKIIRDPSLSINRVEVKKLP